MVRSNIHDPTDSSLLWDSVRVLTRMLFRIREGYDDVKIPFIDHRRGAKRRMQGVMNARNEKDRKVQYQDLVKMARNTVVYTREAASILERNISRERPTKTTIEELRRITGLAERVIDQTTRRVFKGEAVPAPKKIVSIFEPHTDIIVKDRRETYYSHKICISGVPSNLITDCMILDGNPADTSLTDKMLERHKEIYGYYPVKASLDGGFASKENFETAKRKEGIKDVCFAKKRGLKEEDMCRSAWIYK